ncbi:MAG: AAA family ATPase [Pirellulaceae bacterium]|jgi:chromosome partitioning protein|nr:ParA family protein [Planctomycetaceae bacterium]HIM30904.1 ParA family protein [Planctomycetota bacterium]
MRTIAVINQKGGVGKTTTTVNLSAALAESGYRVCLVDLDPQAHASLHLGFDLAEEDPSIYDVLTGEATLADVRHRVNGQLWLVPSHLDLAAAEIELAGEVGREVILRDKMAEDDGNFDFVIVDCPPSLGVLTVNALTAVREVFLPLQPHFLALHGLSKLLRTVEIVEQRLNPGLRLSGVILCLYDSGTRLAAEVSADVDAFFEQRAQVSDAWAQAHIFSTRIRRNIRLAEAPSFGQSIFEYAPQSNGAQDYRALTDELIAQQAEPLPIRTWDVAQ